MPASLQSLRSQGILLVITAADDPESIGWVPWRIAFYALGDVPDLKNAFISLMAPRSTTRRRIAYTATNAGGFVYALKLARQRLDWF